MVFKENEILFQKLIEKESQPKDYKFKVLGITFNLNFLRKKIKKRNVFERPDDCNWDLQSKYLCQIKEKREAKELKENYELNICKKYHRKQLLKLNEIVLAYIKEKGDKITAEEYKELINSWNIL